MKIKIKLNGNEMKAVMFILRTIDKYGERDQLCGLAAMESLGKLFLKLIVRMPDFKIEKNTLTLSIQEAWAMVYHMMTLSNRLEIYEYNVWLKISQEIYKKTDSLKLNNI